MDIASVVHSLLSSIIELLDRMSCLSQFQELEWACSQRISLVSSCTQNEKSLSFYLYFFRYVPFPFSKFNFICSFLIITDFPFKYIPTYSLPYSANGKLCFYANTLTDSLILLCFSSLLVQSFSLIKDCCQEEVVELYILPHFIPSSLIKLGS